MSGRFVRRNLPLVLVGMVFVSLSGCRSASPNPPRPHPVSTSAPPTPVFPWPPPAASATEVVPLAQNPAPKSLGDASNILVAAFNANGYGEKSFYAVPSGHGFVIVTRLEQIETDGRPKPLPERWSADPPQVFSMRDYLRALFTANPGHYRVIVFVVTDQPFSQSTRHPGEAEVGAWLGNGLNVLPADIAGLPYTSDTACTALIYEFERSSGKQPTMLAPSSLDARSHLVQSGLWRFLEGDL